MLALLAYVHFLLYLCSDFIGKSGQNSVLLHGKSGQNNVFLHGKSG